MNHCIINIDIGWIAIGIAIGYFIWGLKVHKRITLKELKNRGIEEKTK